MLPYFYLDACNSIEAGAYSPVMITEMLCFACVVLLVFVICCMIILYNMVKIIRPSGNERARVEYARENQRALPVEGEPTLPFPRVDESARQHCTCNNTTYGGLQAIRRQPQTHDERFGCQRKKKFTLCLMQHFKVNFFLFFFASLNYFVFRRLSWPFTETGSFLLAEVGSQNNNSCQQSSENQQKDIYISIYPTCSIRILLREYLKSRCC